MTQSYMLFLEMFLTNCQARNLRPATLTYYRQELTRFLAHTAATGCKTIEDIIPYIVRAYFVYLQSERKLSSAGVHTAAQAIRAFFNLLAADTIIEQSPMKHVKMPKNDQPDKLPFGTAELKRLIDAAVSQRDRAMVNCLFDSGCRFAEFRTWKYGDVDFKTGKVHLSGGNTKGRRSRVVYLGVKARKELLKLLTTFKAIDATTPLWQAAKTGSQLGLDGLRKVLKRLATSAKVSPAGPHRF